MSGAYVAKPAEVAVDTKPVGWGGWFFPGTFPPGYTISPELRVSAGATYRELNEHGVASTIVDRKSGSDYETREPDSGSSIRLSATMDGSILVLLGPGDQLGIELFYSYSEVGDYWGIEENIIFPSITEEDHGGEVIVLEVSTIEPFGDSPYPGFRTWSAAAITVYDPDYSLEFDEVDPINWDESATVKVILKDDGDEGPETREPIDSETGESYEITFTATAEITDRECMEPLTVDYSDVDGDWGYEGDFEFDLTDEEKEGVVILKAESTVWGDEIESEVEIEGIYVVSFSASAVAGTWTPVPEAYLGAAPSIYIDVYRTPAPSQRDTAGLTDFIVTWNNPNPGLIEWDPDATVRDQIAENVCTASGSTLTASCTSCVAGKTYRIVFYANPGSTNYDRVAGNVTFSATAILSDGSEITHSVVKSAVDQGPSVGAQILIDVDAGTAIWTE